MELLDQHFDTSFGAPDGVKELRELILSLAMRGKLVPQDPDDQPAIELLKEIQVEKRQQVKEGKIRKSKPLPVIKTEAVPYELPQSWEWVRLNDFGIWKSGSTPSRQNSSFYVGDIPWVKSGEVKQGKIRDTKEKISQKALQKCSLHLNPIGSVLIAMYGANIGEVGILEIEATTNQAVCGCRPYTGISNVYLVYLLISMKKGFVAQGAGAAQPNISREKIINTVVPLPPLEEQHRIVAKIDQLMACCDELEKLRAESKQKQLAVHTSAIKLLLDAQEQDSFTDAWQFITRYFGELYSVKENVAELRKAILQLAVMGKLVPQDPNDTSSSELMKEIYAETRRLVKEKKIKKPKPIPAIRREEMPYALPEGWEWVRLGSVGVFINGDRGKNYPNKTEYVAKGIPWINTGHIEPDGSLTQVDMNFITRDKFDQLNGGKIEPGDLVYCLRGATFGKTAIVDPYREGAIASSLMIIRPFHPCYNRYMYRYLISTLGRSQIFRFDNGSAQPNLSANSVRLYVYPLPPLSEQHRIVAKIDQLMTLCDTLEQKVDDSTGKQTELLNALMAQM